MIKAHMANNTLCKSLVYTFTLLLFAFSQTNEAMATPFGLHGTAVNVFTHDIEVIGGTLNIDESPNISCYTCGISSQPDRFTIDYSIDYTFLIGGETFVGNGTMRIRDTAGLFDLQHGGLNSVSNGIDTFHWESLNGAFFDSDGTEYPEWYTHSLAYSVLPFKIEFYSSNFENANENIDPYSFTELFAERITGIPEPTSFAILFLGLVSVGISRCVTIQENNNSFLHRRNKAFYNC